MEGQVKYRSSTLFGRATPDHAGACPGTCPYRVQCRMARCDVDGRRTQRRRQSSI